MPLRIMVIAEADQAQMNQLILDEPSLDVGNPNPDAFAREVYAPNSTTVTGRLAGWRLQGGDFGTVSGLAQSNGLTLDHFNEAGYPQNVLDAGFRFEENTP